MWGNDPRVPPPGQPVPECPAQPGHRLPAHRCAFPNRRGTGAALVTGVLFSLVTIGTMLGITAAALLGVRSLPLDPLQRWMHAIAGTVLAGSAAAMLFLGL